MSATFNGAPLNNLDRFELLDSSGRNVAPTGMTQLPADFVLMAGTYEIVAQHAGQTRRLPVTVTFGNRSPAALTFDQATDTPRPVEIELDIRQPTVNVVGYTPQVQLTGGGRQPTPLGPSLNAVNLAPGPYRIEVTNGRGHLLDFDVPTGTSQMSVRVVITPGWFEAVAPSPGGSFVLQDASGTSIATFTGETVRHSIADGTYTLIHVSRDRVRRSANMTISTGDFSSVRF